MILLSILSVVAFKDAAQIKSWDAWDDHLPKVEQTFEQKEERRPCLPWERLNEMKVDLEEIGRIKTRTSREIADSIFSVGCETLDRDYAVWDNYKMLLPLLGVKHARFFSGWAKTEQEKGKYDFGWLDAQLRDCVAMSIRPWVCISYGNPVWGSDFRLGMRVSQVTENKEALAAWLRYVRTLVSRYGDIVDEWEVWNEPFNQDEAYAELFYRTARTIREIQPAAKVYCTAVAYPAGYRCVLERLKRENALSLGSRFVYHPYSANPDEAYAGGEKPFLWGTTDALRRLVKEYSPDFDILQGECGSPSQLEYAHALCGEEWTEYSQAKWNLRRALGDAVRNIPSNLFTMIDLQYTFMLQSFGLIRSNALKEFVYRRPSWYAMRNLYSLIDCEAHPVSVTTEKGLTCAVFERRGKKLSFYWRSSAFPTNERTLGTADLPALPPDPVWVEMITGRTFNLVSPTGVPMWDSPILVTSRDALEIETLKAWK